MASRSMVWTWAALEMSTTGASPETVIVSSMAPTFISALTVAVKFAARTRPSFLTVWKPVSVKVTV